MKVFFRELVWQVIGAGETGLAFRAGSPDHHADGSRTL